MTSRNDITGDLISSKGSNDAYRDGWDRIFGQKEEDAKFTFLVKYLSRWSSERISEEDAPEIVHQFLSGLESNCLAFLILRQAEKAWNDSNH